MLGLVRLMSIVALASATAAAAQERAFAYENDTGQAVVERYVEPLREESGVDACGTARCLALDAAGATETEAPRTCNWEAEDAALGELFNDKFRGRPATAESERIAGLLLEAMTAAVENDPQRACALYGEVREALVGG